MAMGFRTIIFLLALLVGVPLLQIFLSRRESKWPGLILPLLTFLYALVMALSAAAYNGGIPGPHSGVPASGQHPHGDPAGHLRRLPGEVPQAQRAGQIADQGPVKNLSRFDRLSLWKTRDQNRLLEGGTVMSR